MNRTTIGSSSLSAWHEAGHVVVALALGYEVKSVTAEGGYGLTMVPGLGWMEPNDRARTVLAGPVSEDMYLYAGRSSSTTVERLLKWADDNYDSLHVEESLAAIGGDRSETGWRLLDETVALLKANWRAVETLARSLEQSAGGYLERNEILQVLELDLGPRKQPPAPAPYKKRETTHGPTRRATAAEQRSAIQRVLTVANARGDSYARSLAEQSLARLEGRRIETPVLERGIVDSSGWSANMLTTRQVTGRV